MVRKNFGAQAIPGVPALMIRLRHWRMADVQAGGPRRATLSHQMTKYNKAMQ